MVPKALDNWSRDGWNEAAEPDECDCGECMDCWEREEMERLEYLEAQADAEIERWKEEGRHDN